MYRSSSWGRVSDEYSTHGSSPPGLRQSNSNESNDPLPVYDPIVEMAKKERARVKFAENAVHVIPFVLLLCALTLWFFSNSDVGIKDSVAARIEGLTLDGELYNDSDGTQTGGLPLLDSEDDDSPKHSKITKIQRNWPKD